MKIKELLERYDLKTRQSIYNWCKALDITLAKDSNGHAFATQEQIELLDQLSKHIGEGGKLTTFTPVSNVEIDNLIDKQLDTRIDSKLAKKIEPVYQSIDTQLLGEMMQVIASKLQPANPLWYMNVLENARTSNWLLTTAEVRELIGVKPKTKKGENTYKRGNWLFIKSGKIGNQTAWKVMKEEK